MSPQPQTYSPAQYLEAGHRAEMAGERDRAAQYYNYLAEAFADTLEGDAARAGLARLGFAPRQQPQRHSTAVTPSHTTAEMGPESYRASPEPFGYAGSHQPHGVQSHQAHAEHTAAQTAVHRAQPQQQPLAHAPPQAQVRERPAAPASRIRLGELSNQPLATRPAGAHSDPHAVPHTAPPTRRGAEVHARDVSGDDGLRLPDVVTRRARELADIEEDLHFEKQYRGARLLAYFVTWLGWIVAAGGLALLVLGFVGIPPTLAGHIIGLPAGVVIGFAGLVAGLALALGGQVALATFDQAQSMREIGIMMRARVDL